MIETAPEIAALYKTANPVCKGKAKKGLTIREIALLLHSTEKTVTRYLAIPEEEIPEDKPNCYERQHLHAKEHKIQEI